VERKAIPKQRSVRPTQDSADRANGDSFKIANILVPLDFSRASLKALKYIEQKQPGASRIFDVTPTPQSYDS
jgi:hypothetical protein